MNTIDSFGFIEVYGLVAGIEAADAMLKSANVRLLRQHEVRPGMITLVVEGDLAACRAAVNAGVAAASRVGTVLGSHVIGRPVEDTESMVLDMASRSLHDYTGQPTQPVSRKLKTSAKPKSAPSTTDIKPVPETSTSIMVSTETPPESVQSGNELDEVISFIFRALKGRSWSEIIKRFPKHSSHLHSELDSCVESGKLIKVGARYRKPVPKE